MATHYETLGVKSNATGAEIRKAYLRRARALHPDRQQGRSPADFRKAEQAMQQVNVAWNVLSDSRKRLEYDKRLTPSVSARPAATSGPRTSAPPRRPMPPRPAATSRVRPDVAREPIGRAMDDEAGDGSVSVWASLPVLIVVGLLLGILVITAFASDTPDDDRQPVQQRTNTLQPGDCFALIGDTPRLRACTSTEAEAVVVDIVPSPGNCPAGTFDVGDPSSALFLCWNRLIPGSITTAG